MKWHLSAETREEIRTLAQETLYQVLHFARSKDVAEFVLRRMASHQHEFEHELHQSYPLKTRRVVATPSTVKKWSRHNDSILHFVDALAPEDLTPELVTFPLDAAAIVYLYSLLEQYGDNLAKLIDPDQLGHRKSWHVGLHSGANMTDPAVQRKLRSELATIFNCSTKDVSFEVLGAFVELKQLRNNIVHKRVLAIALPFNKIASYAVAIISHLYFLAVPKGRGLRT